MKIKIQLSLLLFIFFTINITTFSQGKVSISGTFWDDNTGVDLNSSVYGIVSGKKVKLADTDKSQRFNFDLATSYDSLSFESEGYSSVHIPIHFEESFEKQSIAYLSITSKSNFGQYLYKDLFLFCQPTDNKKAKKYELFLNRKDSLAFCTDFTIHLDKKHNGFYFVNPKLIYENFTLVIQTNSNDVLTKENLIAKKGLTFVDLNIYQKEELLISYEKDAQIQKEVHSEIIKEIKTPDSNLPYSSFGFRTLFFNQSKYELKSENRMVLDSLAIYLMHKTDAKVKIAGYTDNIGNENLNTILAKYRAQVVGNYLKNKGVEQNQIQINWEEQNKESSQKSEDLNKYRKVVVSEME